MDSLSRSNQNFFISNNLERYSENRKNPGWLREKLYSAETRFIPFYNLKSPFGAGLSPFYLNGAGDLPEKLVNGSIFLGVLNGKTYFAVDVTSSYDNLKEFINGDAEFKGLRETASLINADEASLLSFARSMIYWHSTHMYCGLCGSKTESADAGHRRICSNKDCGTEHFPRTDPAIIVLVVRGKRCLLARQERWAPKQYATIAGFVEPGETLEQAVQREVMEESGIKLKEINYHSSQPWPFPGAIMLGFHAEAESEDIILHDHELEDAMWISREEIASRLRAQSLRLSPRFSISYRLIEDWFDKEGGETLRSILEESSKK
jgi:NAD+ diphosphatase